MDDRTADWEKKKQEFVAKKMEEIKEIIMGDAKHALMLEENRIR
jgi:hypothetical protein